MPKYRFDILDTEGNVSESREFECDGKQAAVEKAGLVLAITGGTSGVEVWKGSSLVQCLKKQLRT
jgi:hypothetical protein